MEKRAAGVPVVTFCYLALQKDDLKAVRLWFPESISVGFPDFPGQKAAPLYAIERI